MINYLKNRNYNIVMVQFNPEVKTKIIKSTRLVNDSLKDLIAMERKIKTLKRDVMKAKAFFKTDKAGRNIDKNWKIIIRDHTAIKKISNRMDKL